MGPTGWLAVYCVSILAVSLFGGSVPFLGRVTHTRLQLYLSFSAGVMIGASFFHVMPDAMEKLRTADAESTFGWWMSLGVVGLFCIERFIAPHSHEMSSKLQQEHDHEPGCEHDHEHRAAPAVAGWMAVLGLTIHTFMNGVALAGAVVAEMEIGHAHWALPGLALFLAIALHKPADALAISTVLSRKGVSQSKITLVQLGFALMVPIGAGAFLVTIGSIGKSHANTLDIVTGAALAFSAGTFLFIALSDLLPEVQFHRHDAVPLFLALVAGVVLMGAIGFLEDLGHGSHEYGDPTVHHDDDHDTDHDHDHDTGGDKH
jgi:zinc and cadmium transporter